MWKFSLLSYDPSIYGMPAKYILWLALAYIFETLTYHFVSNLWMVT
jgi:hypothetical protein